MVPAIETSAGALVPTVMAAAALAPLATDAQAAAVKVAVDVTRPSAKEAAALGEHAAGAALGAQ